MVVQFAMWGNSLALRIPSAFAREFDLTPGKEADLQIRDGSLVVTPVKVVPTYDVKALIAGITPENVHEQIDTGEPVGSEVW